MAISRRKKPISHHPFASQASHRQPSAQPSVEAGWRTYWGEWGLSILGELKAGRGRQGESNSGAAAAALIECPSQRLGEVAERLIAPVLKTGGPSRGS